MDVVVACVDTEDVVVVNKVVVDIGLIAPQCVVFHFEFEAEEDFFVIWNSGKLFTDEVVDVD